MYTKIAVEEGLTNVTQALQASGFQTTRLEGEKPLYNVRAIVVKGDSTGDIIPDEGNLKVPVISAAGRSAAEIVDILRDRLS